MHDTLIQNRHFLDEQALCRLPECMQYKAELNLPQNAIQEKNYLHVDFGIHLCIQTDFVGWMPQRHVKMLEMLDCLVCLGFAPVLSICCD